MTREGDVRVDPNTGQPARERVTDKPLGKIEAFLERHWRTLMTLIITVFGWYAANVYQPIKAIPDLIQRDSLRAAQHNKIEETVDRLDRGFLILSRINCFTLDAVDRIKYDINCRDIPLPEANR